MKTLQEIKLAVSKIAPEYNIRKVQLFGSYATGTATKDSDIDLLVDYGKGPHSLMKIFGFKEKVEKSLGRPIDIVEYPVENLIFPTFRINKLVDIYG